MYLATTERENAYSLRVNTSTKREVTLRSSKSTQFQSKVTQLLSFRALKGNEQAEKRLLRIELHPHHTYVPLWLMAVQCFRGIRSVSRNYREREKACRFFAYTSTKREGTLNSVKFRQENEKYSTKAPSDRANLPSSSQK